MSRLGNVFVVYEMWLMHNMNEYNRWDTAEPRNINDRSRQTKYPVRYIKQHSTKIDLALWRISYRDTIYVTVVCFYLFSLAFVLVIIIIMLLSLLSLSAPAFTSTIYNTTLCLVIFVASESEKRFDRTYMFLYYLFDLACPYMDGPANFARTPIQELSRPKCIWYLRMDRNKTRDKQNNNNVNDNGARCKAVTLPLAALNMLTFNLLIENGYGVIISIYCVGMTLLQRLTSILLNVNQWKEYYKGDRAR